MYYDTKINYNYTTTLSKSDLTADTKV